MQISTNALHCYKNKKDVKFIDGTGEPLSANFVSVWKFIHACTQLQYLLFPFLFYYSGVLWKGAGAEGRYRYYNIYIYERCFRENLVKCWESKEMTAWISGNCPPTPANVQLRETLFTLFKKIIMRSSQR